MDLTHSYRDAFEQSTLDRYDWCEVRNAASIIKHTNPDEFEDLAGVLDAFKVIVDRDITPAGGNESLTAGALNAEFRTSPANRPSGCGVHTFPFFVTGLFNGSE